MSDSIHYLQLEPTTRCNYTCGFCAGRHMAQVDMKFSQFTQLIDALPDLKHIELQGEGEPLLHPQLFQMVNYIRKNLPSTKISLITNGSLFTQDTIEKLLTSGISCLMVSLESADDTQFQSIRGGKLSRVKRGIANLMETKRRLALTEPVLGFAVTLLRDTLDNLSGVAKLYQELELDGGILMQPLQTMQAYRQYYDEAMDNNILQGHDYAKVNHIIASDGHLRRQCMVYKQSSNFYVELYTSVANTGGGCPWLQNGLMVNAQGIAASCCFIKNPERDGFATIDNNLAQILQRRQAMAARLYAGDVPMPCKDCGVTAALGLAKS